MMKPENIARIVCLIMVLVITVSLFLIRRFIYKDTIIKQKKATLIQKKNYERRIIDGVMATELWLLLLYGLAQPWGLLDSSPFFGRALTLLIGLLPLTLFGGFFFGFYLQKNDFDWLLIVDADVESKTLKLHKEEIFLKEGVKYVKASNLKDAENENFMAILIDVERDRFWKAQMDDDDCQVVFADEIKYTKNQIEIKTFIRDGGKIVKDLLDSETEREIKKKDYLTLIIKEQEEEIMRLVDECNLLKAQGRKELLKKIAENVAVFFVLFEEVMGLATPAEKLKMKKIQDDILDFDISDEDYLTNLEPLLEEEEDKT